MAPSPQAAVHRSQELLAHFRMYGSCKCTRSAILRVGQQLTAEFKSNDQGHFLGGPTDENAFMKQNAVHELSLYPNQINTDEGQDATMAIVSARDSNRDGTLIAEINWGFRMASSTN